MAVRRKTVIVVLAVVVVILATAAFLASILIDPDRYRPQVISFLQAKTGKEIEIAHIAVKWIPLSIRLDSFGSKNPKPFPAGYFVKAARIEAAVDAMALLHRQIVIKSIIVQDPIINVISDPDGLWNFENPPSPAHKRAPIFDLGIIPTVTIAGGQLFASSLIDPWDRPGPVVFEVHNLAATLNNVNFNAFTGTTSAPVATGNLTADLLRLGSIEVTKVGSRLRLLTKQVFFDDERERPSRARCGRAFIRSGGEDCAIHYQRAIQQPGSNSTARPISRRPGKDDGHDGRSRRAGRQD